jgi:hypothetical protein
LPAAAAVRLRFFFSVRPASLSSLGDTSGFVGHSGRACTCKDHCLERAEAKREGAPYHERKQTDQNLHCKATLGHALAALRAMRLGVKVSHFKLLIAAAVQLGSGSDLTDSHVEQFRREVCGSSVPSQRSQSAFLHGGRILQGLTIVHNVLTPSEVDAYRDGLHATLSSAANVDFRDLQRTAQNLAAMGHGIGGMVNVRNRALSHTSQFAPRTRMCDRYTTTAGSCTSPRHSQRSVCNCARLCGSG